jgi:hypothetical protein
MQFLPSLHYTTLHYTTLHYTTLHYTTLHYTTLHYTTLHYTTIAFYSSHTHTQYDLILFTHNIALLVFSQYDWSRIMESGETLKVRNPSLYLTSTSTAHLLSLTLSLLYSVFSSLYSLFSCPISIFRILFFVFYCRLPNISLCLDLDLRPSFYLTSIFISFHFRTFPFILCTSYPPLSIISFFSSNLPSAFLLSLAIQIFYPAPGMLRCISLCQVLGS